MSYIRPLEGDAGLYIYPQTGGINFCCFPEHSGFIIPDECLDILLARMSNKELTGRIQHGQNLLMALYNSDYDYYKQNKNFFGG